MLYLSTRNRIRVMERTPVDPDMKCSDEFTTEMHWEMLQGEMTREEFLAWAAYGAVQRGTPIADALAEYNVSEDTYDKVTARKDEGIVAPADVSGEEHPYKSPEGYLYPSYQAYCNDPDLDSDLIQCKLASGMRTPQNEFERELLKEIKEARAQGKVLEIYPE